MRSSPPYEQLCFVAMPFGKKAVNGVEVDFDNLYDQVFAPAIASVQLPEGGYLIPHRADKDFYAAVIDQDMYEYLEYSRFVLADISGHNANVVYELGVRHRSRESGTAIFKQDEDPIPFDVDHVRVFSYSREDDAEAAELVRKVLTASLERNQLDSPVAVALRSQRERQGPDHRLDKFLLEAENAIRSKDLPAAIQAYRAAIQIDPGNFTLRLEAGVLLRDHGDWAGAVETLEEGVRLEESSAATWRELGVALNKLHHLGRESRTGENELRRAVELDPRDADAWASLGGGLKRKPDLSAALDAYERATSESAGAAYPFLNAMKLKVAQAGPLVLTSTDRLLLRRARKQRAAQVAQDPPYAVPWSFFDLAEIALYFGELDDFERYLEDGVLHSTHGWQLGTFANSLRLASLPGPAGDALQAAIERLSAAAEALA